jgi:hypothetical protein
VSASRPYWAVSSATVGDVWSCSDCGALVDGLAGQVKHDGWHDSLEGVVDEIARHLILAALTKAGFKLGAPGAQDDPG